MKINSTLKKGSGFIIVQELFLFGIAGVLLVSAVASFTNCVKSVQRSEDLQRSFAAAQRGLVDLPQDDSIAQIKLTKREFTQNGLQYTEVLAENGDITCSIVQTAL